MILNEEQFNKIKEIFEELLKQQGYDDFSEICGDETEDFSKEIIKN